MLCGPGWHRRYGLEGPGIESRWRQALGPTRPPVHGGTESFPGIKRPKRDLTTHTHLAEVKVGVELYLFPLCASLACYGVTFMFVCYASVFWRRISRRVVGLACSCGYLLLRTYLQQNKLC